VFYDPSGTLDRADSTWIYGLAEDLTSPPPAIGGPCFFVEMKDGVVVRTYRGRIVSWTM
jgi:hypothetical protein